MQNENTPPEETDETKQETEVALDGASYSSLLDAEIAPKDGTVILGAFGWPWLVPASWNEHDETWTTCNLQASPMEPDGKSDSWWETEWEKPSALQGWLPMPPLPEGTPIGGFLSPPNAKLSHPLPQETPQEYE